MASKELEFTGERFTPECVREIRYEHMHRYALAAECVRGRDVLDAACGEGYGSSLLAAAARSVTGVDLSEPVIRHAAARYRSENLAFQVADCCALPFPDDRFGAIVSFETLEHLEAQERLLREFRRVLAPDGFLLISSPDRAVYTDRMGNRNPFHVRELDRGEFEALLSAEFPATRLLGQRLAFHSMIWPIPGSGADNDPAGVVLHCELPDAVRRLPAPAGDAVYFIAACAARQKHLPKLQPALWLFDDAAESVYRHYHHEIRKNMEAGGVLELRDREIAALQAALGTARDEAHERLPAQSWWRRWLKRF